LTKHDGSDGDEAATRAHSRRELVLFRARYAPPGHTARRTTTRGPTRFSDRDALTFRRCGMLSDGTDAQAQWRVHHQHFHQHDEMIASSTNGVPSTPPIKGNSPTTRHAVSSKPGVRGPLDALL